MHAAFQVHMLTEGGKEKAKFIAKGFDELLAGLQTICAEGREMSLCITNLEQACFWAKKAMAKNNHEEQ